MQISCVFELEIEFIRTFLNIFFCVIKLAVYYEIMLLIVAENLNR